MRRRPPGVRQRPPARPKPADFASSRGLARGLKETRCLSNIPFPMMDSPFAPRPARSHRRTFGSALYGVGPAPAPRRPFAGWPPTTAPSTVSTLRAR